MQSNYSKSFQNNYAIDEESLKNITKLLSDRIGEVSFFIECQDDITRESNSVSNLFEFPNTIDKEIIKLSIVAKNEELKKRASVKWSSGKRDSIIIDIEARDDVVIKLRNDLFDILHGMIPWYDFLRHIESSILVFLSSMGLLIFGLVSVLKLREKKLAIFSYIELSSLSVAILFLLSYLFIRIIYATIRDKFFPAAVFLIGQGKSRYLAIEKAQWGVIIAFFVSLISGLGIMILTLLIT